MHRGRAILLIPLLLLLAGCKDKSDPVKPAAPVTLISNLNGAENADLPFDSAQGTVAAAGFRMPADAYTLTKGTIKLRLPLGDMTGVVFKLFGEDALGDPGLEVVRLRNPAGVLTSAPYSYDFTPVTNTILLGGSAYWIVGYCNAGPSIITARGWVCGDPSTTPTGLATHVGSKFSRYLLPDPPIPDTTAIGEYAVVGVRR